MKHVDHQVQAYCDGELSPSLAAAFEAHVRECAECRGELAATRGLWARVDAAAGSVAPRRTWPAVAARVAARGGSGSRPESWSWSQRGLAVAAMVAGIAIGFGLGAGVPATEEPTTASADFLEESLPTLDQSWLQLGDQNEDAGS